MNYLQKRSIATSVILAIVTFGLYNVFLILALSIETARTAEPNRSSFGKTALTLFLPPVGLFLAAKNLVEVGARNGIPVKDHSILAAVFGLFGPYTISGFILQKDINNLLDTAEYNEIDGSSVASVNASSGLAGGGFGAICPECGTSNAAGCRYCARCGKDLFS